LHDRVAFAVVLASIGFSLPSGPCFLAPAVLGNPTYGLGSLGIGVLYAADGLGFVLPSVVVVRLAEADPLRLRRLYGASYLVQAVRLARFCRSARLWQGVGAIPVSQVAAGSVLTLTAPLLQMRARASAQARVVSFQAALGAAAAQPSIAASGWAMARFGVAAVGPPVGLALAAAGVVWVSLMSDAAMLRARPRERCGAVRAYAPVVRRMPPRDMYFTSRYSSMP
jgi:hypothetical protein